MGLSDIVLDNCGCVTNQGCVLREKFKMPIIRVSCDNSPSRKVRKQPYFVVGIDLVKYALEFHVCCVSFNTSNAASNLLLYGNL